MILHSKPFVGSKELNYVSEAIRSHNLTNGTFKERFLTALCNYLGVNEIHYTDSGTDALIFLLKALNIKENDEIILPTYVCEGVFLAVLEAGYKPVLCDIGENWNTTAEKIKEKISPNTGAIIMVYIFGLEGDIENILALGYPVIEDVCQSFGLKIKGKVAGTFGIASFCSFGSIKCLTTGGTGGCIFSTRDDVNQKLKDLANERAALPILTEINAAYGLAQIENYEYFLSKRIDIANQYNEVFSEIPDVQKTSINMGMNYRFITKVATEPDRLINEFAGYGISLRKGVDQLLHKRFNIRGNFSNSEETFNSTISWPIYPELTQEELNYIFTVVKARFKNA